MSGITKKSTASRLITCVIDKLPIIGRIKEHKFTTTLGDNITFVASENCLDNGKKVEAFYINVNPNSCGWSSRELRELAIECNMLAEYIDKRK